jgi:hypothetical protein
MSWLIPTAAGSVFAILLMSTTALAHGCHQSWQQSDLQGWHRHGQRCETRQVAEGGPGFTYQPYSSLRYPDEAVERVVVCSLWAQSELGVS